MYECDDYGDTGTGGGAMLVGEDEAAEASSGADETGAAPWEPELYVYETAARQYAVDQALVSELLSFGYAHLEADHAWLSQRTQGYCELRDVVPGDLAHLIGLRTGDVVLSVNSTKCVNCITV